MQNNLRHSDWFKCMSCVAHRLIDEFQINEINVDLRTSGFDNEVLSVDTCAVWRQRVSLYCLPSHQCCDLTQRASVSMRKCADWVNLKFVYRTAGQQMAHTRCSDFDKPCLYHPLIHPHVITFCPIRLSKLSFIMHLWIQNNMQKPCWIITKETKSSDFIISMPMLYLFNIFIKFNLLNDKINICIAWDLKVGWPLVLGSLLQHTLFLVIVYHQTVTQNTSPAMHLI